MMLAREQQILARPSFLRILRWISSEAIFSLLIVVDCKTIKGMFGIDSRPIAIISWRLIIILVHHFSSILYYLAMIVTIWNVFLRLNLCVE